MIKTTIRLILAISALFFVSCNLRKGRRINCEYTINKLFKDYDSNAFKVSKFQNETDVFDTGDIYKERGIYKFNKLGKLFFYAFLLDDSNYYDCSMGYDSLGNIVDRKGGEVIRWFVEKPFNDTTRLTFLFYGINFSYSNIFLQIGDDKIQIKKLGKSLHFSNLIGNYWKIPLLKYPNLKTVYISGWKKNLCTGDSTLFSDSVHLPHNNPHNSASI